MNKAEEKVARFYNTVGWQIEDEITEDAKRYEDLRENAKEYVSKCRLRVLKHIPQSGLNILDMASGPIQYKEYLEYSKNFVKRYCIDLSMEALNQAKNKIGDHGVFLHGSFFDIPLEKDFFDCAISLHTIYHIDKEKQEEAIRKLLYVTKPGKPVIVVYGNPGILLTFLRFPLRMLSKIRILLRRSNIDKKPDGEYDLFYYTYPTKWWKRFSNIATVKILPWRSFDSDTQKRIIPDNKIGKKLFDILFYLEDRFPNILVRFSQYPMIILTKK